MLHSRFGRLSTALGNLRVMRFIQQQKTLLLCLVSFFALWSVRATFLYGIDQSITVDFLRTIYSTLVKFALWVGFAAIFVVVVKKKSLWSYLGLSDWLAAGSWTKCLVVGVSYFSLVVTYEIFVSGKSVIFPAQAVLSVSGILFFMVSPFIEELLFRGLILKEFLSTLSALRENLLCSLLFVGIHLPFWLTHNNFDIILASNCIAIFFFSLIAGWLYIKSWSIWPSVLIHIANNILSSSLVMASSGSFT